MLVAKGLEKSPSLIRALDLVFWLLPSKNATYTGKSDDEVLEILRDLAYRDFIPPPTQSKFDF